MNGNELPLPLLRRGKVRDVYDLGDKLLLLATDRLSAFDWVLPTPVPEKGALLTAISEFWFGKTAHIAPNHFISRPKEIGGVKLSDWQAARATLVKKAKRIDYECVVRGWLSGSGWSEYEKTGAVCGEKLPPGLHESERLPVPIFTPAAKNDTGHDENVSFARMAADLGAEKAAALRDLSLALYNFGAQWLEPRGIILADTKFEFGEIDGEITVIDELLTPDSSRFWDKTFWKPGGSPPSFDKQFARDYLSGCGWDKNSPPPPLPPEITEKTAARYREAFSRITERTWK
ncbi:MAG: phosphoribosylaminoimidazolesuccinocarboxamide synthase [Elusimicrobiales bacterium]